MSRRRRQSGFTLIEMLMSLAILTVVTIAMGGTFLVGYTAISREARAIAADTAISDASLSLTRDLQTAAAVPTGSISSGVGSLALTYGSPAVAVTYTIDAGRNLIRNVGGKAFVAGRGMTSVTVALAGCYATVTLQPSATGAAAQTLTVGNRPGGCL
jgi:prepilin-type N-terminal cleavage/methylation domain-containing protein